MFETIAGASAHSGLVRVVVVLMPVAAILAICSALSRKAVIAKWGLIPVFASAIAVVCMLIARSTGSTSLPAPGSTEADAAQEALYAQLSSFVLMAGIALTGMTFLLWQLSRREDLVKRGPVLGVRFLLVFVAVVSVVTVALMLHEGAQLA